MMSQKGKIALLFAAVVLFCFCASGQVDALTIAENGVAKAVIVVVPDSPEPERHAAAELAEFLHQITGAKFTISNVILWGRQVLSQLTLNFPRTGLAAMV